MTESENTPLRKRRIPIFVRIMIFLLCLFVLAYMAIFFGLNYFGEKFLRRAIKQEVTRVSGGLYNIDFDHLNINILTGNITIHDLDLSPDTSLYNDLKEKGKVKNSLYRISVQSLSFGRVNYLQIWTAHRINLNRIEFARPKIGIVGFPDTVTARRNRWRVIYEDIYPMISKVFKDFHVDSVIITRGLLLTTFRQKTGRLSLGEYDFSSILRNVSVNKFSYYNRERVFYSKDIDWVIHNLQISLGDSLYFLKADQIGFSLARSRLWGNKVSLIPNFRSARIKSSPAGDFFQVDIPDFFIEGVDLYKALVGKEVEIGNVQLQKVRFKMFRNSDQQRPVLVGRHKKKLRRADAYTIIAGALKSVSIDSFSIKKASVEYYNSLNDHNPELRIAEATLDLSDFYLDSLAHRNRKKIYYSSNIELSLRNISLRLHDRIHFMNSEEIWFSTRKSRIGIRYGIIYPDKKINQQLKTGPRNLISCLVPGLEFYGVNLRKVFNEKILDFDRLEIMEPDVTYTKYRESQNPDPRFRLPKDFFQEENKEVVYDFLKKYVKRIKGNMIQVSHGRIQLLHQVEDAEVKIASGTLDLTMYNFLIDSLHGLNQQGYFYSQDFTLDINSFYYGLPDSSILLKAENLHINTTDSLIRAHRFSFYKMSSPLPTEPGKGARPGYDYDFTANDISILGLNHRKLFLEKILKANTIILEKPSLRVEAGEEITDSIPEEIPVSRQLNFPRRFEIGRMLVRYGSFFFDGREEEKVAYFSIQDVDFGITNAVVQIPPPGQGKKEIKFDSLQLSVFPVDIVLADSAYTFRCSSLTAHSYPTNIVARDVRITPLKLRGGDSNNKAPVTATVNTVNIKGFYFDKAVFEKHWRIDAIELEGPKIIADAGIGRKEKAGTKPGGGSIPVKLPLFMKSLDVGKTTVKNGLLELKTDPEDPGKKLTISNIKIIADHLRIDSATQATPRKAPLFFCEDVAASSDGYSWISSDSMYSLSFKQFGFSTREQSAHIDSFSMVPNYSRYDFCRKIGHQVDRLEVKIPLISFTRVDFQKLFYNREIFLGKIMINDARFNSYRDRRVPLSKTLYPLLPAQRVRKIGIPLTIDTITAANGSVDYEEQTGEVPGKITFNRMNAMLVNLSTDTSRWHKPMIITGTTYLMDKAPVEATFRIPISSASDTFSIVAQVGEMSLSDINPMLSKLLPVKISSGIATKTEIMQIRANDDLSTGYMMMHYRNINIELQSTKPGTWPKWETALKSIIINWILPDSNPPENGKTRHGYIYFERDKNKGFFNFVWKSALSGVKSSFGFNTKEQKELKKADKKRKK
ncbi:MAG: hypothetical protein WCO93_02940 [bacterium]